MTKIRIRKIKDFLMIIISKEGSHQNLIVMMKLKIIFMEKILFLEKELIIIQVIMKNISNVLLI